MQIKYRQFEKFGCGSYSLANLFDDAHFIENIRTDDGERLVDLNRKLEKYAPEYYLEPVFLTNPYLKSGDRFTQVEIFDLGDALSQDYIENWCRPMLFTFCRPNKIMHCVVVIHDFKNNKFVVIDSCENDITTWEMSEYIEQRHIVGIETFGLNSFHDPNHFAMVEKKSLPHIFEIGE